MIIVSTNYDTLTVNDAVKTNFIFTDITERLNSHGLQGNKTVVYNIPPEINNDNNDSCESNLKDDDIDDIIYTSGSCDRTKQELVKIGIGLNLLIFLTNINQIWLIFVIRLWLLVNEHNNQAQLTEAKS